MAGRTVTDTELMQGLRDSPTGEKLVRQREGQWLAKRKGLAAELAEVEKGLEENAPKLQAAEEAIVAQVRRTEERLQKLRRDYGTLEERQVRNRLDGQKSRLEDELLRTAPAEIDEFMAEMIAAQDMVRRRGLSLGAEERPNLVTGERPPRASNVASVNKCLAAISDARSQAEGLKLEALSADELGKRLGRLRARIPAVEG